MGRVRHVDDSQEFERVIDEYIIRGYRVIETSETNARLKENTWGDGIIHIFLFIGTVWWTLGLGNALYATYKRVTAEEIRIQITGDTPATEPSHATHDTESSQQPEPVDSNNTLRSSRTTPTSVLLHTAALVCVLTTFAVIFTAYTGFLSLQHILLTVAYVAVTTIGMYAVAHHPSGNTQPTHAVGVLSLTASAILFLYLTGTILQTVSIDALTGLLTVAEMEWSTDSFLPEWWPLIFFLPAIALIIIGAVRMPDRKPYSVPPRLEVVVSSPVTFGVACTVAGLWAVLFAGISIQRIIVIAPIFEELLKFGVALTIGSALFGRSLTARIGVALIVGGLFGMIEHVTTYPDEADTVYLFRSVFHMLTAGASVAIYTVFERDMNTPYMWIAPAFPIAIHFFHNTFVVLSSVLMAVFLSTQQTTVPLVYGTLGITLTAILLIITVTRTELLRKLHTPLVNVLFTPRSD